MLHMLLMSLVLNINTDKQTKQGILFAKSRDSKLSNSARLSDLEAYIGSGRNTGASSASGGPFVSVSSYKN